MMLLHQIFTLGWDCWVVILVKERFLSASTRMVTYILYVSDHKV